jgi:hypothetical protein
MPAYDARRCLHLTERVFVDADLTEARVAEVEKLTIEDVAVKLETLIGGDGTDDND